MAATVHPMRARVGATYAVSSEPSAVAAEHGVSWPTAHCPLSDGHWRGWFHGPTPPRLSAVILVTYPGGGSGIPGKITSGPR